MKKKLKISTKFNKSQDWEILEERDYVPKAQDGTLLDLYYSKENQKEKILPQKQWLESWIKHPEFEKRLANNIEEINQKKSFFQKELPYSFPLIFGEDYWTEKAKEQKEISLKNLKKVKEFYAEGYDANTDLAIKYSKAIFPDNKEEAKNEALQLLYGAKGQYNSDDKTLFINSSYADTSTPVHEYTHSTYLDHFLKPLIPQAKKVTDEYQRLEKENPGFKVSLDMLGNPMMSNYKSKGFFEKTKYMSDKELEKQINIPLEDIKYLNKSQEIYPRIMQLRFENNIKPGQIIDKKSFENIKKTSNQNEIFDLYQDEEIIDLMNKLAKEKEEPIIDKAKYGKKIKTSISSDWEVMEDGGNVNTLEGDLISKVLMERNRDKDFVQRAFAVGQYPGSNMFTQFEDFGTRATHKMGWGEDDMGQSYMFPTIMNDKNEAIKVPNQYADYISEKGYKKATGMKNGGSIPMMPDGGRIPKAGDGKTMGYSWSTQKTPTQQVVGSVENVQTSKPSIQPFQKGYVNPNIMTSKTGEEGLGDDLGGMMVTAALAPGSLPFRASSKLGRVGLEALELANPISGFRGINSMSSSVDDIGEQLTRATNELPPLNTSSNIYRGSDLDIARYNNMTENINTTNIDPSLQDFHNSIRDRVLNTYNNLPSDEFGFTIHTPSRKQVLKKNIIESSIDAIKNPKKTVARLQYDYERGALNPKSLYYNQLMDALPGDKVGGHGLFGDAEKGFKEAMNKSAEVNPGRMFGEANLSSDSFPLLLAQLRRKAKDVEITHTGEFVPLNNFGNKSKSLLTAAKNPEEGQESILKYVNEHIDKLNKEAGSKIPYAKVINRKVHIPYILAEKKGATLTDKLQRNKTVGLLGTGAATLAGIKPAFDYANTYNQEKFEKDYNEYIKNKPLQNWEQYPLQQKKSGGKVKLKPKSSDWEIVG